MRGLFFFFLALLLLGGAINTSSAAVTFTCNGAGYVTVIEKVKDAYGNSAFKIKDRYVFKDRIILPDPKENEIYIPTCVESNSK
jgi:adenine-specific DNA methylase